MKKSFLFLFLMALLPLVSWAKEVKVSIDGGITLTTSLTYSEGTLNPSVYVDGGLYSNNDYGWYYSSVADPSDWGEYVIGNLSITKAGYYKIEMPDNGEIGESPNNAVGIITVNSAIDELTPVEGDITATYEIQVTPQSGVTMPWGGDIIASNDPGNVITLSSTVAPYDVNLIEGLKEAVIKKLKVNEAEALATYLPSNKAYTYSLGLIDETDKEVMLGGVKYIIAPVSDAQVIITTATNKFAEVDGEVALPVLVDGLTYTGEKQNLIQTEGATAIGAPIEYFVTTTQLEATDGVFTIAEEAWTLVAEGLDAGTYWVYARPAAAEAGDYEGLISAGVAVELGSVDIAKATPTIVWEDKSSVAEKYYVSKFENGLVVVEPKGAKVMYKNAANEDVELEGAMITYVFKKGSSTLGSITTKTSYTINPSTVADNYKVIARFNAGNDANANFKKNFKSVTNNDDPKAGFAIVAQPTVTVTPTAPTIVGQGTDPVFTYEGGVEWEDEEGELKGTATYTWYSDEACTNTVNDQHPAIGTYYVKASGLTCETHMIEYKPLTVIVAAGDVEAYIADATLIYGQPLPLTLKHTIGLAEADVANFERQAYTSGQFTATATDGTEYTLTRERVRRNGQWVTLNFAYDNSDEEATGIALPVGTYEVSAEIESEGYNVFVAAGTWTVVAKDITNEDTGTNGIYVYGLGDEFNYEKEYAGAPIIPTAGELSAGAWGISYRYEKLDFEDDLEVAAVEGKNNINAGTAYFLIKGKGNFTGQKEMEFNITKATIDVKPAADQTWTLGTEEKYALDTEYINDQLKGQDKHIEAVAATETEPAVEAQEGLDITTAEGFRKLAVKRICSTTVGNHAGGLQAYKTDAGAEDEEFATNYNFTFRNATADLAIEPGTINLALKDVTTTYAGKDVLGEFEVEFELVEEGTTLSDLLKQDGNWQRLILNLDELTENEDLWTLMEKPETGWNAGTYTDAITLSDDATLNATNYTVNITDRKADLTIDPAEVTLTVVNQGPMELDAVAERFNDEPVVAELGGTVEVTEGKLFDEITDLVSEIKLPETLVYGENEITLTKVDPENTNYVITIVPGVLTIGGATGDIIELALTSNMEEEFTGDWAKLTAYEGKTVDKITLQLKPSTMEGKSQFSQWDADKWYAMVLPFAVKVKEISKAFDFAYVNVVDPAKTQENDVYFKLAGILDEIPANEPFCIKTSVPYLYEGWDDPETEPEENMAQILEFEGELVIDLTGVTDWMVEGVDAGMGYKFAGTYAENYAIDNTLSYLRFISNRWYYIKEASTNVFNMAPYTGFVNLGTGSEARNVNFHFEEADGTVTSIKAIDVLTGTNSNAEGMYNLNGMKMNTVPTQKGVYIQNGKKVVK